MTRPSALESADTPVEPRPTGPARCVLLVPGAVVPPPTDTPAAPPAPAVGRPQEEQPEEQQEDESADPVGDGRSDAELARHLDAPPTATPPTAAPADDQKGR